MQESEDKVIPVWISQSTTSLGYVDFEGPKDKYNPLNWSLLKKYVEGPRRATPTKASFRTYIFSLLGITTMVVAMASSIFSPAIPSVMRTYGVNTEIGTLGISLYVLGFATGPLCWAPLSELRGRYLPLVVSMLGFTVFCLAAGASDHLYSLLILRYFAGFSGAGPLTLAGAVSADLFSPEHRGIAVVLFCFAVFMGPLTAPFIGGFVMMNDSLGLRWTEYIPGIIGGGLLLLLAVTLKETYQPVLLVQKADQLRKETGDWSIRAQHEEFTVDIRLIVTEYLGRPILMLVFDPIVLCMCVFGSFVYGLLYLFLTAYPAIFQQVHGMNAGVGGLPYLGIVVGQVLGALGVFAFQPWITRRARHNHGVMMPEWRLLVAVPGAIAFSAGLFWLGWSGYRKNITWVAPAASGLLTGYGLLTMFLPSLAYLVEARQSR